MVFSKMRRFTLSLALALGMARGQLEHFDQPNTLWTASGGEMQAGNGLFLSPDGGKLVASFLDGSVRLLDPMNGVELSSFVPTSLGTSIRGFGGITFSTGGLTPYMVYAITDDFLNPTSASTRVIALSMTGEKVFESVPLPGVQAGTPKVSSDGRYVFMTHNVAGSTGYFTILDTAMVINNAISLDIMYQNSNDTNPFSDIGYYHNPVGGANYDAGQQMNTNDFFVWGFATPPSATAAGTGQMFGFQFPIDDSPIGYFLLGGERPFQASTRPIMTNGGNSMYWAVTRAQQLCWVDQRVNRGFTSQVGFTRGEPRFISSRAPPSITAGTTSPTIFGPGAAAEIWRGDSTLTTTETAVTNGIVSSRIQISPDNQYIYYSTNNGVIAKTAADDLANPVWTLDDIASYEGEMALNPPGTILYVGNTNGLITAYEVGNDPSATLPPTDPKATMPPTPAPVGPSAPPTDNSEMPSESPTSTPAPTGTAAPTPAPTITHKPTGSAKPSTSAEPTDYTDEPTAEPTMEPTAAGGGTDPTPSPIAATSGAPVVYLSFAAAWAAAALLA